MDGGGFELQENTAARPVENAEVALRIKIVGVGGGGTNTVDRLRLESEGRAYLAAVNTDAQALGQSPISEKVLIGRSLTRGMSTGGEKSLGRDAAEADQPRLAAVVRETDLVFIVAGLGGGTGSGAAPVLARLAREQDAMVLAFVTLPFAVEGARRLSQAEEALVELRECCDAVVPLPNDLLLQQVEEDATVLDAFARADEWIGRGIHSICDLLQRTGLINLDFAALRSAFVHRGGKTLFCIGHGEGPEAAEQAVQSLSVCPLLHTSAMARKADRILLNIIGGAGLSLQQVNRILAGVTERFASRENCVLGAVIDESLGDRLEVCVIGTTDLHAGKLVQRAQSGAAARPRVQSRPAPEPPKISGKAAPAPLAEAAPASAHSPKVHASKLRRRRAEPADSQEEFDFAADDAQRGYFDHTDRNLFNGEDLDVPTYLRRGIRIAV